MARFKKEVDDVGRKVLITFGEGDVLEACLDDMPEDIRQRLALHGLAQKIGDSYAGVADAEKARQNAEAVLARLKAGEWSARSGDGSGRGPSASVRELAQAISKVKNIDFEIALEKVQALDRKARNALRNHPQIMREIARIRSKEAPSLDDILA